MSLQHSKGPNIDKVVIPVAGRGTRFLPATKAVPKEMIAVLDKPLIQYAVDEAVAAGARTLIFVCGDKRHILESYFSPAPELESALHDAGKEALLARLQAIKPDGVECLYVEQKEPRGLGDAIYCARDAVGDETFGVMLPDDLILSESTGAMQRMFALSADRNAAVAAVEDVPADQTHRYGIVSVDNPDQDTSRVNALVEKPPPGKAPSTLAIVGRYVLPPQVFPLLENTRPGAGGEVQITDAINTLVDSHPVLAFRFPGRRFDCGNVRGHFAACLELAQTHPDLKDDVAELAEQILGLRT